MGIIDDDALFVKGILEGRGDGMQRSSAPFSHSLGTVVGKRGWSFDVAAAELGHVQGW